MKIFAKFSIIILIILLFENINCFSYETVMTREGCYIDRRGQINSPIDPPHPEYIPTKPNLTQPLTSWEDYYDRNVAGERDKPNKLPDIPGYTKHYSERSPHSYTKEQYMNVWAQGIKVGNVYLTNEYAMSYFFIDNWASAISIAKIRAMKHHKQAAVFLFIEELGSAEMLQAKRWAELWGVKIFFGTIDKGIPAEWVQ